jgi:hypothetical protein
MTDGCYHSDLGGPDLPTTNCSFGFFETDGLQYTGKLARFWHPADSYSIDEPPPSSGREVLWSIFREHAVHRSQKSVLSPFLNVQLSIEAVTE